MGSRCLAPPFAPATPLVLAVALTGCATLHGEPRAAPSLAACVRTAAAEVGTTEGERSDKRAHCLVAARIAHRCSPLEARLAAYAKELRDLFGRGDAERADLHAGRAGIRCAREHGSLDRQAACCRSSGY